MRNVFPPSVQVTGLVDVCRQNNMMIECIAGVILVVCGSILI